jgi:uncharacterized membrane protein
MTCRVPDLEPLVWTILGGGLLLSILFILAGLAWGWTSSGTISMGPPIPALNLRGFLEATVAVAARGLSPAVLLNCGIAVLLLTPYASVVASVIFFTVRDHDYRFTAVTGFVAVVLTWVLFLR